MAKVRRRVFANALLSKSYLLINFLATIVASYGLLANSTAVVIGAMLIATLLGPISGIALALVDANYLLLRRALLAELVGALLVICTAFLIGMLHRNIPLTPELLSRTHPNLLDLMIAIAGGAAGGYSTANRRLSQGLVGTAIATALVPPLASCGICLAHAETRLGWGAFLLFFANLVAIQFASSVVLWISGYHNLLLQRQNKERHLLNNAISAVLIIGLGFIFALRLSSTLRKQAYEGKVRDSLTRELAQFPGTYLADLGITVDGDSTIILAVVRAPFSLGPDRVAAIEKLLPKPESGSAELHVQSVIAKEVTSRGYLHETKEKEAPEDQLRIPYAPVEAVPFGPGGSLDEKAANGTTQPKKQ